MMSSSLLAIAAVFVLAGTVKGITGMGLPTVAVSLLGLWMPPAAAAALLVLPSLATNVGQSLGPALRPLVRRLWPAWGALVLATLWVPELPASGSGASPAHAALGAVLVAYGAWGLWRPGLPDLSRRSRWLGIAVGLVTGVVTGTTAVFVIPFVPYLQSLRLGRDELVQALGLSFTVATLALALRLQGGAHPIQLTGEAIVALLSAFVGMALGTRVRNRIGAATFQRGLFAMFVMLGFANLGRAL
ncbi:sulfite exporter TauE/SafE family protein [Piscinibacter koreensis]|uniref:Probable membrane transporter protein n=1 Tax=Piscinibacter koreensis TaxID=2742824 RepID=A0A7Y6NMX9_9BURK|nr:TSUP family transporter [Schlegelella koreensis]NUZ06117.1 sulfite exporter TauE/SafE family protein [Schlegelella koreensis]